MILPILEYDDAQSAVFMPTHEKLGISLPKKAVFAFLGDTVDNYALSHGAIKVSEFLSATKLYPIYIIPHGGEEICLCQAPVGAAPATQILDWLIGYGVRQIISSGSCGVLADMPENTFLLPTRALRDEGTSYHYLPPSRYVDLNADFIGRVKKALEDMDFPYAECTTWTTDGFFRETRDMVLYRKSEGCEVVEMECSALAACAEFRGAEFSLLLFTGDTLANVDVYDEREWGKSSHEKALRVCLDVISKT